VDVASSQQKAVLCVGRNLAVFNGFVVILMLAYANAHAMPMSEINPSASTAALASIPLALSATLTLASAVGPCALACQGVLPTRHSAIDEATSIDVLCVDKPAKLPRTQFSMTSFPPLPRFDESHLLTMAALASSGGGQDAVDVATFLRQR
jgi:H+-transporting ATPase